MIHNWLIVSRKLTKGTILPNWLYKTIANTHPNSCSCPELKGLLAEWAPTHLSKLSISKCIKGLSHSLAQNLSEAPPLSSRRRPNSLAWPESVWSSLKGPYSLCPSNAGRSDYGILVVLNPISKLIFIPLFFHSFIDSRSKYFLKIFI